MNSFLVYLSISLASCAGTCIHCIVLLVHHNKPFSALDVVILDILECVSFNAGLPLLTGFHRGYRAYTLNFSQTNRWWTEAS